MAINQGVGTSEVSEVVSKGVKFGMVDGLPSYVTSSGKPFLWGNRPLIVKNIAPSGNMAEISVKGEKISAVQVQWNVSGPVLVQGYLVEFNGSNKKKLSLISPFGERFETLNVDNPIIDNDKYEDDSRGKYYATLREDGDFRLVRSTGEYHPKNPSQFLAVKKNGEWKFVYIQTNESYGGEGTSVFVPTDAKFSEGYCFSDKGYLLHYESSMQYPEGILKEVSSISLGEKASIERISPENRELGTMWNPPACPTFTGNISGVNIRFCIDISSGSPQIPYLKVNGNYIFHNPEGRVLWPESLKDSVIQREGKIDTLKGFEGTTLYIVQGGREDRCTYTDGKQQYYFNKIDGKIATYNNPDSPYHGYPISANAYYSDGSYGAYFSGESGRDFVMIATEKGNQLVLPAKPDFFEQKNERVVYPNRRSEVATEHAKKLNVGFIINGFHPKAGIIVLRPRGDNSTSFYRYYGVGIDGTLIYLGSKNNIGIINNGETAKFSYQVSRSDRVSEMVLLGSQNESRAFMLGNETFLPVLNQEGGGKLLRLQSDEYRELILTNGGTINIPSEWIVDGKLSQDSNLRSLLQFFPGTEKIFDPSRNHFADMGGLPVETDRVEDIPTLRFGEDSYYILSDRSSRVSLWNPKNDFSLEIPYLTMYPTGNCSYQSFPEGISGLTEVSGGMYVYPAMPGFPENVRIALLAGEDGLPTWSYVWYNSAKNSIVPFTDKNNNQIYLQDFPRIYNSTLTFSTETDMYMFDASTSQALDIPSYKGLSVHMKRDGTFGYFSPKGEVEYDDMGKPREVLIDGKLAYVLDDECYMGNWIPGEESPEDIPVVLCYIPETNISAPYFVREDEYVSVFDTRGFTDFALQVNSGSIFVGENMGGSEETWYNLEACGKNDPGVDQYSRVFHSFFYESGEYAIASGRTISEILRERKNPTRGRSDGAAYNTYLVYKSGNDTCCFPLGGSIKCDGDSITIDGVQYDREKDKKLLDSWLQVLAEKYVPKVTTESLTAQKQEDVANTLDRR